MKSPREHMEIVNAYELVGSYRGVAELCGTTHKTVKRVLERRDVGQPSRRVSATNTVGVQALIAERVRASDGRISAKRLLPMVPAAGYSGSARNLRRAVATAKAEWKRKRRTYREASKPAPAPRTRWPGLPRLATARAESGATRGR